MVIGKGNKGVVILKKEDAIKIRQFLEKIDENAFYALLGLEQEDPKSKTGYGYIPGYENEVAYFKNIQDLSEEALILIKDV